jgi:hypothetical protein
MMLLLIIFSATPSGQNLSHLTQQLPIKKEKKWNLMKMERREKKVFT